MWKFASSIEKHKQYKNAFTVPEKLSVSPPASSPPKSWESIRGDLHLESHGRLKTSNKIPIIDIEPKSETESKKLGMEEPGSPDVINEEAESKSAESESITGEKAKSYSVKSSPHESNSIQNVTISGVAKSDKAYAFLLGGIPSATSPGDLIMPALGNGRKELLFPANSYRGLLYNILVSVKILRNSGSTADMVVLVKMASANEKLPSEYVRWMTALDIRIQYVPASPSIVNEFSTITFEKFRLLDLVDYKRILYMDADVTPRCNLDYIMDLSMGEDAILQPNFLVSIGDSPVSSSFFMLAPGDGKFKKLLKIIAKASDPGGFRGGPGWGKWLRETDEPFKTISNKRGMGWDYDGADSDQGLLHHWAQWSQKKASFAIGNRIENWVDQKIVNVGNPLIKHSCLPEQLENNEDRTALFSEDSKQDLISPLGVAPYRDFLQWRYSEKKPWHHHRAPLVESEEEMHTPVERWFGILQQLDDDLQMGLAFDKSPESNVGGEPNWKFVPKRNRTIINPAWSTTVKSVTQWALRSMNSTKTVIPWEPPVKPEILTADALPLSPATKEKRVFVCVTGQFDRFEAQSKIQNMFLPLQEAGYKTDVALILSNSGETAFTNHDLKDRKNIKTDSQPFYENFDDVVKDFEAANVKVLFAQNGTYSKVKDPPLHEGYFKLLFATQGRSREQQENRVKNHARIFESYTRCLDYADAASREAIGEDISSAESSYYDAFIRIREDVGFSRPFTKEVLRDLFPPPPGSMTVTECRSWQGINDRFAIASPDIARTYFERPYEVISKNIFVDGAIVKNPESFLLYSYVTAKLRILGHPEIRNLNRMMKTGDGKVKINGSDSRPGCPNPKHLKYRERLYELYDWFL